MGYIRQLKDKDLVGGTTLENIYPITATSAVYGEDGRSLDLILSTLSSGQGGNGSSTFPSRLENYENIIIFGAGGETMSDASIKAIRSTRGIPVGWSQTSNIPLNKNLYVYMATGKKINGSFVPIDGNYYWSHPLRISGAPGDSSTSNTGADGANINFIYYRTNTFIEDTNTILPLFDPSTIESITNKNHGVDRNGALVSSNTAPAWRDHPLGISKDYNYEYISVNYSKANSAGQLEWQGYSLPSLWSNWGEKGIDGDGVEYIFCLSSVYLTSEEAKGLIDKNTPKLGATVTDPKKDDFLPSNPLSKDDPTHQWEDNPLPVSESDSYLYVAIRKKTWNTEDEASEWLPFSDPVLWSRYGLDGVSTEYSLLCDNDNALIDDDVHSNTVEALNATFVLKKNGEEVPDAYYRLNGESTTFPYNNSQKCYRIVVDPTTGKVEYTLAEGIKKIDTNVYVTTVEGYIKDDTGTVTYNGNKYKKVASRRLIILVRNFSSGEVYKLVVSPLSIKVDLSGKISDIPVTSIKILEITSNGTLELSVNGSGDISQIINGSTVTRSDLEVEVKLPNNSTIPISDIYLGSDILINGDTVFNYIIVNLWLNSNGARIRVDTETISVYLDGKDGKGIYNVAHCNGTIILDNDISGNSIDDYNTKVLKIVSSILPELYKGDLLIPIKDEYGNPNYQIVYNSEKSYLPTYFIPLIDESTNPFTVYLLYTGRDIKAILPTGYYKFCIDFLHPSDKNIKYTSLIIDFLILEITPDGTVFRLNISNNLRVFDSDGSTLITTKDAIITAQSITNGVPRLESFVVVPYNATNLVSNLSDLVLKPESGAYESKSPENLYSIPSGTIKYSSNSKQYELYYKGILVDREYITCIKNGADGDGIPGASGQSEYLTCDVASVYYDKTTKTCIPPTITISYMITRDKGIDGNSGLFETICDTTKDVHLALTDGQSGWPIGMPRPGKSGSPISLNFKDEKIEKGIWIEAVCGGLTWTVPITFSAELGIEGCIIRLSKFTNDNNITYRNDSKLSLPRAGEVARYIDVIWDGEVWSENVLIYMTLMDWSPLEYTIEEALSDGRLERIKVSDPSYIPLLITDNLVFKTGQGNNLYLMNSKGNIVGGMMSTDSDTGDPVRIFAGTDISTINPGQGDVNQAKFRVTLSGKLFATDAIILGSGLFTGIINAQSGLFTGPITIQGSSSQLIIGIDGSTPTISYWEPENGKYVKQWDLVDLTNAINYVRSIATALTFMESDNWLFLSTEVIGNLKLDTGSSYSYVEINTKNQLCKLLCETIISHSNVKRSSNSYWVLNLLNTAAGTLPSLTSTKLYYCLSGSVGDAFNGKYYIDSFKDPYGNNKLAEQQELSKQYSPCKKFGLYLNSSSGISAIGIHYPIEGKLLVRNQNNTLSLDTSNIQDDPDTYSSFTVASDNVTVDAVLFKQDGNMENIEISLTKV